MANKNKEQFDNKVLFIGVLLFVLAVGVGVYWELILYGLVWFHLTIGRIIDAEIIIIIMLVYLMFKVNKK